jgi:hypothetical protein
MPVDRMFTDPMLGPFRNMMEDVEAKGLSGPDADQMRAVLGLMESLAEEMDDFAAWSGKLAQDQLFGKFSDAYSRALAAAAKPASGEVPSDGDLLAQQLGAIRQMLRSYENGQAGEDAKMLVPHLKRMIGIGESGVSFPVYLRMVEEEGLNRVLDGAAPVVRSGIEQDLQFAREAWLPRKITEQQKVLEMFDGLAATAPFGQPDPLEFSTGRYRIEWEFGPEHRLWSAMVDRWQYMLSLLVDWLDAHTSFAPTDPRWCMPPGTDVQKNILRTKECGPGRFRFREALFREYFGLDWDGIWAHETFTWEYTANRIEWSDERLRLIRDTYPCCVPGAVAPPGLVKRAEELHPARDNRPDRLRHPPVGTPLRTFEV